VHCCVENTHAPLAQRTGWLAGQLDCVGQSMSDPRHDPSGQRMGLDNGHLAGAMHLFASSVQVTPSAHRIGWVDEQLVVEGHVAVPATHDPSGHTLLPLGHTRGLTQ
jgi:hypothetical protein